MRRYILSRFLGAVPILLGVTFVSFVLTFVVPGDPARLLLGIRADEATVMRLRQELGLDEPFLSQYLRFTVRLAKGDLGHSYSTGRPVVEAISERLMATATLTSAALLIATTLGIFLGTLAVFRPDGTLDRVLAVITLLGASLPVFFIALLLIWFFSYLLNLAPASGYAPGLEGVKYLVLPGLALSLYPLAAIARLTRTALLEILGKNFIRVSLAMGHSKRRVIFKYALRNALLPVVTTIGNSAAFFLSGAFFVEYIFGWPGIGLLGVDAISRYDYPVIQGVAFFTAFVFIGVNLLVDILYGTLDPRIRVSR